ncbi:MAG: MBG domain-containing protein, partial [Clostridiales Family XIII bacterium]|nr:MBG domain-containing protein [Clostridiales Family XIII bacterium]
MRDFGIDGEIPGGNTTIRETDAAPIKIYPVVDPSGYVYEAVTSNRVDGVTATAWWYEPGEDEVDAKIWDSAEYEQNNPLQTDYNGRYAWDTPEGMWQVRFEKDGYESAASAWLPVPPPQLEVNVGVVSFAAPEVAWFNAYDTYAEVEFTKYLKPETVNALTIQVSGGETIAYTLEYSTDETSIDGTVYAKRYKLIYNNDYKATNGSSYTLATSSNIQSYAGVAAKQEIQSAEFELPLTLITPETVQVGYGESTTVEIKVGNYDPAKPLTVTAESDFDFIAEVGNVGGVASDGNVTISVVGNLPGNANIIIRIEEKGIEAILPVSVIMTEIDEAMIVISPVEVNIAAGGAWQFEAIDEATGLAAEVIWSLSGNTSNDTNINGQGLLSVAEGETAEKLTVTATEVSGERTATATVYITAANDFILGDVNGDGAVNMQDVLRTYQYFRAKATLDDKQLIAADVNRDTYVNIQDVLLLYQHFRGRLASFTPSELIAPFASFTSFASAQATGTINLTVAPSKAKAAVGEEVTFTVSMSSAAGTEFLGFAFEIAIPQGFVYKEGSAAILQSFRTATGWTANFDEAPRLLVSGYGNEYNGEGLDIATFICTAEAAGSKNVTLSNVGLYDTNVEIITSPVEPAVVDIYQPIPAVEFNLSVPVFGEVPQTTVSGEDFTGVVTWTPTVESTFSPAVEYTATINLQPRDESIASFGEGTSVTINGEYPTSITSKTDSLIVATKAFPETDKAQLTGSVNVRGETALNAVLTAVVSDLDTIYGALGELTYQWKSDGDNVGENSAVYTVRASDIGKTISVAVSAANYAGSVNSPATETIAKGKLPDESIAFSDESKIYNGEVQAIAAASVIGDYSGGVFTYTYSYSGAGHEPISNAPRNVGVYIVTLTVENADYVGTKQATLTIDPKALTSDMFSISDATYNGQPQTPILNVNVGESLQSGIDYTAQLASQINAASYTVVVTGMGNYTGSTTVDFIINKAEQSAPSMPTEADKTYDSVTLNAIGGAEYRVNEGQWQDDVLFSGLSPNTQYAFYARFKSNENYNASLASEAAQITTPERQKEQLTGRVSVSGAAAFNAVLTVVVSDLDTTYGSLGELTYQWKSDGDDVGENSANYTVQASDIGKAISVTVSAENYVGSVTSSATDIVSKGILSAESIAFADELKIYNGEAQAITAASVIGDYSGGAFTYTYSYTGIGDEPVPDAPKDAGIYVVTLMLENTDYIGTKRATLTIEPKALTSDMFSIPATTYNGQPQTPILNVDADEPLQSGIDYIAELIPQTNAAAYAIVVTGKGNYTGNATVDFLINKAEQSPPAAPSEAGKTYGSVTLDVISGAEYRMDEGQWQDDALFSGLSPNTQYAFYARFKSNENYKASPSSEVVQITTTERQKEQLTGWVGISGNAAFNDILTAVVSDLDTSYGALGELTYQWKSDGENVGENSAFYTVQVSDIGKTISVAVSAENYVGSVTSSATDIVSKGILSAESIAFADESKIYNGNTQAIAAASVIGDYSGGVFTYTYSYSGAGYEPTSEAPKDAGIYVVTLTVENADYMGTKQAAFVINKAEQSPPSAPAEASKTYYSITLNVISGAEYRMNDGQWQEDVLFSGLNPNTQYTFYARFKSNENYNASPASDFVRITTLKAQRDAPTAPTLARKTASTITLNIIPGAEYRLGVNGAWQKSVAFGGLTPETGYIFYARLVGDENQEASPASQPSAVIITDKATSGTTPPSGGDTPPSGGGTSPSGNAGRGLTVTDSSSPAVTAPDAPDAAASTIPDDATPRESRPAPSNPFQDVSATDWFSDDVSFVYAQGLFNGQGAYTFGPNALMNRAMLVTVLHRLGGELSIGGISSFSDVATAAYYAA